MSIKKYIFILMSISVISCNPETSSESSAESNAAYQTLQGNAQGTTYSVTFQDPKNRDLSSSVDSLLKAYDLQLSSYMDESVLSELNASEEHIFNLGDATGTNRFEECYELAKDVYYQTNGSFNPALYPVVEYWGFFDGNANETVLPADIDSLLKITPFGEENFALKDHTISRKFSNAKLDFNGIAQGHSVDVLGAYLSSLGISNFLVEIGGEVTAKGLNPEGTAWTVGIEKPIDNSVQGENDFQCVVGLEDRSLATSGNYRKFYIIGGKKYSHTINPVTGEPVSHNLLSVTVIAKKCANADAYATAFMVMGLINSIDFINNHPDLELEAYFVFDVGGEMQTSMTKGFDKYLIK